MVTKDLLGGWMVFFEVNDMEQGGLSSVLMFELIFFTCNAGGQLSYDQSHT